MRVRASAAAGGDAKPTNVLVVGGGGREHALSWRLAASPSSGFVFCAPGNAGIAQEDDVTVVPGLDINSHDSVAAFCRANDIGLVVIGPEAPLVDGMADALDAANIPVFGPSKAAARLEGSKAFMKDICKAANIPTAAYEVFTSPDAAKAYIRERGAPIVIKTSGLAAGKGVTVAMTVEEALGAVDAMMVDKVYGDAGSQVVVEDFLSGEEASFFALCDGSDAIAFMSAQDHKPAYDGDKGPNTGGMGAYSPAPVMTPEIEERVMAEIVRPLVKGMADAGCPYKGVLFVGLMIDDTGAPRLVEFNVRFGDPECQVLLTRLQSDLCDVLVRACGSQLGEITVEASPDTALTVVMAAKGYPGSYKKGTPILGLDGVTGAKVFHAGTAEGEDGGIVAAGGRVLSVTASGRDAREAQERAYAAVDQIDWEDGFCRRDIGWRAVARLDGQ
ncbi:unnamed protein product [Pedinophyceae sp. YPF-701]|nr:unnamed protein product [Pedinophyceae sp. YPF-701]